MIGDILVLEEGLIMLKRVMVEEVLVVETTSVLILDLMEMLQTAEGLAVVKRGWYFQ